MGDSLLDGLVKTDRQSTATQNDTTVTPETPPQSQGATFTVAADNTVLMVATGIVVGAVSLVCIIPVVLWYAAPALCPKSGLGRLIRMLKGRRNKVDNRLSNLSEPPFESNDKIDQPFEKATTERDLLQTAESEEDTKPFQKDKPIRPSSAASNFRQIFNQPLETI